MRYSQLRDLDIVNGLDIGAALFVQGCPLHCPNCFNQSTWDFEGGKEFDEWTRYKFLRQIDKDYIKRISILGGEPLAPQNIEEVLYLMWDIKTKYPNKQIWLYSGYGIDEITSDVQHSNSKNNALTFADYLVVGRYIDKLKDLNLKFRGSSNQKIYHVNHSKGMLNVNIPIDVTDKIDNM
jgi:anaerobic ribonucleoside-triphosphate reductase activating protein